MNQTRTIRLPIHVVKELNVYLRLAVNWRIDWIMSRPLKRLPLRWDRPVERCVAHAS